MKPVVVHVITGLHTGGAELALLRLALPLRDQFQQRVISLMDSGPVAERLRDSGVPVESLGVSRESPNPLALPRLARRFATLKPALIQTWMYHADLLGGIAGRLAGVRAIAWNIRNNDLPSAETRARTRSVVKWCARLSRLVPARIVSCAQSAMATHVALGYDPNRFIVIPNGFDLQRYQPDAKARSEVRAELKVPLDVPLIGLVARFDPQKNHALFLQAAARLHARRPQARFVLAGEGVDGANAQICSWVRAAGLEGVVHLLGRREDVARLNASFDIASSSSSWGEGFPNVLGEAMACGVPCVATDTGDVCLIIGDTGCVVPRDDPDALADAWSSLLALPENGKRILGERARARIAENFSLELMVSRYKALYLQMTGGS